MELPDDAPKSPKLLFLLGDAAFLGLATFLAITAGDLPSTASIVGIIVCTGIGVALGIAPFLLDYARSRDQQLTERQNSLEALVRSTSTASDQASIAANGLHEIAEITKRNLHDVEQLPAQIQQAKTIAQSASEENHAAAVSALQQDLSELRASHEAHIKTLLPEFKKILKAVAALKTEIPAAIEIPPPVVIAPTAPVPEKTAPADDPDSTPSDDKPATPKPRKKKAAPAEPKKKAPAPAEPSLFEIEPAAEEEPALELDTLIIPPAQTEELPVSIIEPAAEEPDIAPPAQETPAVEEPIVEDSTEATAEPDAPSAESNEAESETDTILESEPEPAPESAAAPEPEPEPVVVESPLDEEPPAEPAISADGLTRLTVTAYIGIGNRLFVRGNGPGLSPDEGTPLQFVSIGKWRWETDTATAPFNVTLWKNDSEECTAAGQIEIAPGAQVETTANF